MKPSLKSKRSRKGRKSSQEPSSSRTHESEVQTESPPPLRLVRRKSPRIKRKRTPEPERDAIPSPPKAKKRKKRNLSSSESNLGSSESGSSQGEAPSHLQEVRLVNDDITKSSSFAKYLKVIFVHFDIFFIPNCIEYFINFKDVRNKAIQGQWKDFDYNKKAETCRFKNVSTWLLERKPELQELLYNGLPTGYFKCCPCASNGDLHIIKAFDTDHTKFKKQNIERHFKSRSHLETGLGKVFAFSSHWKKEMNRKYLKLMATQRVSGKIFRSDSFVDILVSWINQVTNSKVDSKTILDQLPSRRTLRRKMLELSSEQTGNFFFRSCRILQYCLNKSNNTIGSCNDFSIMIFFRMVKSLQDPAGY